MSAKPMTRQAWLDYLKKAVDEFDWEAAGQEREWVGLTDEERYELANVPRWSSIAFVEATEAKLKEKNT